MIEARLKNSGLSIVASLVILAPAILLAGEPRKEPAPRIETGMHTEAISSIAVDSANRYLVTASEDKTLRVWNLSSGELLRVIRPPLVQGHDGELHAVAMSPDGKTIAAGHALDGSISIFIFDRETGRLRQRIDGFPAEILRLAFSADGRFLAATLFEKGVRLLESQGFTRVGEDGAYEGSSYGATFSRDGRLATTSDDGFVHLYALSGGEGNRLRLLAKTKVAEETTPPRGISFSPDGAKLAVGFYHSPKVAVLSAGDLSLLLSPDVTGVVDDNLWRVAWAADGRTLFAGGMHSLKDTNQIRAWSQGGAGAYTDLPAAEDTIVDLVPLADGGVLFGSTQPAFGRVNRQGKRTLYIQGKQTPRRPTSLILNELSAQAAPEIADMFATAQSPQTAELRQAAEKGDMSAAYRLGVAFRDGIGVPQDYVEANVWIGIAALLGVGADQATYAEADKQLASKLTPSQSAEVAKRLAAVLGRLAEAGLPKAQLMLGVLHFKGMPEFGVPQDYALAFAWIQKAATQGDAEAAFILGVMYEGNSGTTQDFAKAVQWFRKAAEQGNADGQLAIGQMYEKGLGVPRDVVEAHKWMNLATSRAPSKGQKKFTDARDQIAQSMTAEQIAEAQKRAREWTESFDALAPPMAEARKATAEAGSPPAPLADAVGGVVGGIPEGVIGGVVGGVVEIGQPDGVLRVGGDVKAPVVLQRVEPVYPEVARKARVSGIVILEAVIDRTGAVKDVRVLEGLPFGLDEAAVDAVKQWRFAPATLNGQPVDVLFNLTVSFKIDTPKAVTQVEERPPVAVEPAYMSEHSGQIAEINTSVGTIAIRLLPDVAPNHVRNFIDLARKGFYNGTKFHRVIPGFMIQGGDPNTKTADTSSWGTGGSGKNLKAEFNDIHHARGIVSMARAQNPDSASSQFFICVADSGFLDRQYTAFGEVVSGMDVADKIVSGKTTVNDRPADPVEIKSVMIRDAKEGEKGAAPK